MGRSKPRTNKKPPPKGIQPVQQPIVASGAEHVMPSPALGAVAGVTAAGLVDRQNGTLPIDLPASLAALFEAKLTLDREKAKLMRMQKELKGYRDGMGVKEAEEECTCGRNAFEEYYEDEHELEKSDCEGECECDCHEDYEYEQEYEQGEWSRDDYQEDPGTRRLEEEESYESGSRSSTARALTIPNPYLRHTRRPLSEDPERLDEAVRELFNWIKAVVWTIEQAAIVAGRRNA